MCCLEENPEPENESLAMRICAYILHGFFLLVTSAILGVSILSIYWWTTGSNVFALIAGIFFCIISIPVLVCILFL